MRSYIGFVAYLFAFFGALLALEALFAAWWDLPEESMLPFFAAAGTLLAPLLILRRGKPPLFRDGMEWSRERVVASSAALAAALLVFSLVWGLIVRERWTENLGWSVGGAAAAFAGLLVVGYIERYVREREACKRGVAPGDYKPGKLARRVGLTLAVILGVYIALGFLVELTDALS